MKNRIITIVLFILLLPTCLIGQVSIGDILCTDGSILSREAFPSSGKTAEGIVFYIDNTDTHGWAVALNNQSSSIKWCRYYEYDIANLPNINNARNAMHDLDGHANTGIIRAEGNSSIFPAAWAVDYDNGWYLPSAGQLRHLYSCAPEINASLQVVGGTAIHYQYNFYWWSSTEHSPYHAFDMNSGGSTGDYLKDNSNNYPPTGIAVRQIRDFTIQQPIHPTYHIGDIITNNDGSRGILFYVSPDQTDGWMVALNDAASATPWGDNTDVPGLDNQTCAQPFGALLDETNGYANTGSIRNHQNGLATAANAVDYQHGWYLPTAGQLLKLFGSLAFIEDKLQTYGTTLAEDYYWSSSEANDSQAFGLSCAPTANVRAGHCVLALKSNPFRVRAVRNIILEDPVPVPGLPDNILEDDCNAPLHGSTWDVHLLYSTPGNPVASYAPVIAGDIDGNGLTDIVMAHYKGNNYRTNILDVYSGIDLSLQYRFNIQDSIYVSNGPYAIGKYPKPDGTLQGAIFVHGYDKRIRSYSINGTLLNVSDRPTMCDGMVSLADFNGDGYPEVYAGSDIFDAATLKWLCSGPENGNMGLSFRGAAVGVVNHHRCYFAMSLASNVLGDENQELICGNTLYNVNIVSRTNPSLNSVTVNKTITPPYGCSQDGHTSLADFDLDGECEVLVIRDDTDDHTLGTCHIYAYKPSTGQILFQRSIQCLCTGYPLIGNIDDDPHPEIVFLEKQSYSPMYIYCWRYTSQNGLTTIWQQPHNDLSGQTGITLFDFNQDNIMELVYRDSDNLRIINGSGKSHVTGNDTIRPYNLYARMMSAGTGCEYPIVADVNGDGSAEIIVAGLLDQSSYQCGYGGIHILGNPGSWAPARKVWNQYMYHVTNVNEDLTIPTYCFNRANVFTAPDGTIRRPYNNFLQQATYITPTGEPYNPGSYVEAEHYGEGCETYYFHGITYTESGDYEYLIENPLGCDTLLTVHVYLGDTVHATQYKSVCQPYIWNGITYEETGIYQQTFTSAQGCDSIVTLYLNVGEQIMTNIAVNTCDSYTWNGMTYTESGLYEQSFITAQGCDSIVILDLTIRASSYVSPIYGENLIYYETNGTYTYSIDPVPGCFGYEWSLEGPWSITSSPESPECTVNITSPGTATLKVRVYTECGYVERSLFINHDARPDIVIYPNPTQGEFNIVLYGMEGETVIVIYDYLGQFIGRFNVNADMHGTIVPYSLAGKAAGMYMVTAINRYHKVTKKVIKETPSSFGIFDWEW